MAKILGKTHMPKVLGADTHSVSLRIDYCDERLVYSNGDISVTKGGTSPAFSIFIDITWLSIQLKSKGR